MSGFPFCISSNIILHPSNNSLALSNFGTSSPSENSSYIILKSLISFITLIKLALVSYFLMNSIISFDLLSQVLTLLSLFE